MVSTTGLTNTVDHVVNEAAHPGCGRVVDRAGDAAQNGMPHPGDLQQSHDINM
jgi:hypothetical protein